MAEIAGDCKLALVVADDLKGGGTNRYDYEFTLRFGPAIVAYELAYVAFVAFASQTLAPLRGRLRGLAEWRTFRRVGAAGRRAVDLDEHGGIRHALARRRAYRAK